MLIWLHTIAYSHPFGTGLVGKVARSKSKNSTRVGVLGIETHKFPDILVGLLARTPNDFTGGNCI